MRDFLSHTVRSMCLLLAFALLTVSVASISVQAQPSMTEASTPPSTPPSIEATAGTNANSLRSTSPSQSEPEFKNPPHVYDMKSIREFDRQVYQTREQQPQRTGDQTSK